MDNKRLTDHKIDTPVVGVLTTRKKVNGYPLPTGRESKIFKEMVLSARARGILLYYFYPDGLNWNKQTVRGHTWKDQEWVVIRNLPMADIVYNRIVYRQVEARKVIQALLTKLQETSEIIYFNTRFLDKWEVHKALQNHPNAGIVPRTESFNRETLLEFIRDYQEIFIKPCNGNTGKGIIKIRCISDREIYYAEASKRRPQWKRAKSSNQLYQYISRIIKVPEKEMIIQEGILLAQFKERVFDIRTLIQKDGRGEWTYIGAGVRIAPPKGFVTHIPNGGTKADIDRFILRVFGNQELLDDIKCQIIDLVKWIPQIIEERTGLSLAVLSMDLGLDREGKIRLIEVNSKPASFDEAPIRKRHLEMLNDYFIYAHQNHKTQKRKDS